MRAAALQISADMEQAQRLAATEKARLKNEIERSRKELDQLGIQIREAHRTLEQTVKQNDHQRAVGRAMFASIA